MKIRTRVVILFVAAAVAAVGAFVFEKKNYPFGRSHCCILGLLFALEDYATQHDGKYPAGESSPEAALSLLYNAEDVPANILRGMTVPEEKVRAILEMGELLGPDSCGWHYVPGLTKADDPKLAMLWCKVALNHNGGVSKNGGREVLLIDGFRKSISGAQWAAFLAEQQDLMNHRTAREKEGRALVSGRIELPDGSRLDKVDGSYKMTETKMDSNSSGSGSSSGSGLTLSDIVWYRAPCMNGYVTRTLAFSNLASDPVTVNFKDGVPDLSEVIFKMRRVR